MEEAFYNISMYLYFIKKILQIARSGLKSKYDLWYHRTQVSLKIGLWHPIKEYNEKVEKETLLFNLIAIYRILNSRFIFYDFFKIETNLNPIMAYFHEKENIQPLDFTNSSMHSRVVRL